MLANMQADDSVQANDLKITKAVGRIPLWVALVTILGASLMLVGAVISKAAPAMLANGSPITEAARVYADYLFARNLPLAGMLLFLLAIRSRQMLAGFMVLIALIQVVDALNDVLRGAVVLAPGLLVFAVVFLIGAWTLFGQAVWHLDAWRN